MREYGADARRCYFRLAQPFEYNGIKFFNGEGYKLSDSVEEKIEELILDTEGWGIELPMMAILGTVRVRNMQRTIISSLPPAQLTVSLTGCAF